MKDKSQIVITISRQLGSGGAYIGQQLAKKLDIVYLDREIITKAARQLSAAEEDLELRDEKVPSFWKSLIEMNAYSVPNMYLPPQLFVPTEGMLFNTEAEIIKHIADEKAAVIIGRCGAHILREHPHHVNIFLYGDKNFRIDRIMNLYGLSEEEARKKINKSDMERSRYIRTFTGKDMTDTSQYDLTIDTSRIGVDNCVQLILQYLDFI